MATLDLLEGGLIENAARMGARLRQGLEALVPDHRLIGDVRGVGLMQAVELVSDREKKTKAAAQRNRAVNLAFQKGLLLLGCGENSIRFIPPLMVSEAEIDRALAILDEVLTQVEQEA